MQALSGETGQIRVDLARVRPCTEKDGKVQIRFGDDSEVVFVPDVDERSANEDHFLRDSSPIRILKRKAEPRERLTGPIQFLLMLLEFWQLGRRDAVSLLGFSNLDAVHVAEVLDGLEIFRGRDANDRIAHLLFIRETLHSLFRDLKEENKWLREPHVLLDDRSPLALLLGGSMEDLLLTREYVDAAAGR